MASEIRVDKINSLSGVGTVTLSPTGVDIAGITTVSTLSVGSSVGIGTTNPSSILHVSGSSTPIILNKSTDASPALFIGDSNRDTEGQHLAEFRGRWNGTPVARMIIEAGDDTSNKDNGELTFETAPAGSMIERVRIKSSGDVIVGSGITLGTSNIFAVGIATIGSQIGADTGLGQCQFQVFANAGVGLRTCQFGDTQVGSAFTDVARFEIANKTNGGLAIGQDDDSNVSYIRHRDNGGNLAFMTRTSSEDRERVRITSVGRVGIGSTIPTTSLDVNGVISGNGSGLTAVNTPSFAAKVSGNTALTADVEATIVFNSEDHDTDGAYNTSTGEFTVPSGKGGRYFISVNFGVDDPGEVGDIIRLRVFKNGTPMNGFRGQNVQAHTNFILTTSVSGTVTLAAGDVIKCMAYTNSNVGDANIEVECTYFSMFRLSI